MAQYRYSVTCEECGEIAVDATTLSEALDELYGFELRVRAVSDARANEVREVINTIVNQIDSNWQDCKECSWPGTVFEEGRVRCTKCSWSTAVTDAGGGDSND